MKEYTIVIEFMMPYNRIIEFKVQNITLGDITFQIIRKDNILTLEGGIRSETLEEAYDKAQNIANLLRLLMLYRSNIGLIINDIKIPPCIQIDEKGRHIEIDITEEIKFHERTSLELTFNENSVRGLEKLFSQLSEKYNLLDNKEKDKLNRIIRWYIKGLMAEDNVDKFIYYYIVLDAIAGVY